MIALLALLSFSAQAADLPAVELAPLRLAAAEQASPSGAPAVAPPHVLIQETSKQVIKLLLDNKNASRAARLSMVEDVVLPHFDFRAMTMMAMNRHWRAATPAQQAELVEQFRRLLVRTYSSSLDMDLSAVVVDVKAVNLRAGDAEATVRTTIRPGGKPPLQVDYRVEKQADGWKAVDVVVEGVSLVLTYRSQFGEEIQRSGIDGLIDALKRKNAS